MPTVSDAGWCVVMSKPMAEEAAAEALQSRGWRVYVPMARKQLRGIRIDPKSGKRTRTRGPGSTVLRPALPGGYFFVELHPDNIGGDGWRGISGIREIERIMTHGAPPYDRPHLVGAHLILRLRADENDGMFDEQQCRRGKRNLRPDLDVGSTVRQPGGPFSELAAVIEQISDDGDKATISYILFGRRTPAQVDTAELLLVSA